jgi:hypothetical protein
LTGDPKYESAVEAISQKVHSLLLEDPTPNSGLVPIFINANTGKFRASATITLGARGDSYYEYLLKQWVQTGKTQNYLKEDFLKSVTDVSNQNWLLDSLRFHHLSYRLLLLTVEIVIVTVTKILGGKKKF